MDPWPLKTPERRNTLAEASQPLYVSVHLTITSKLTNDLPAQSSFLLKSHTVKNL